MYNQYCITFNFIGAVARIRIWSKKGEHLYGALHGIQTTLSAQTWITQFNLQGTPCLL